MIDIEALAAPAFLVEVSPEGTLAGARLNALAHAHPALAHSLSSGPACMTAGHDVGKAGEAPFWPVLSGCATRRLIRDLVLTAPDPASSPTWRACVTPLIGPDDRVTALLGICREDWRPGQSHPRGRDPLSLTLQAIHGAEWRYDVMRGVYEGSHEIATLIGEAEPRSVTWAEWLERLHPQDFASFLGRPDPEGVAEFRFYAVDGDLRWGRCSRIPVVDEAGAVEAVLGIMVDITQERVREAAWAELATHDPLTGLLNRRGLRQEFDRLQADSGLMQCLAVFAIDLDHFKGTNDAHGHAAGDAVLVEASRRLCAAAGGAACARLGGDEFVAVVPVSGEAGAQDIRERLRQAFQRPLAFRGHWLPVSASIGSACASGAADIARLMDEADADLYARKHANIRTQVAA